MPRPISKPATPTAIDSSAVIVALMSKHGVNYLLAILIGLLVGIAGGAVNGVLVAFAGASSFIITLAMGQVFNGFEYLITKQETIFQGIPNAYTQIATGTFLGLSNQFFIMLGPAPFLDNQYTVFGKVVEGIENVQKIERGDKIKSFTIQ